MWKLIIVLLLLIFLGWLFFPDAVSSFVGHLGDEIRDAVSF